MESPKSLVQFPIDILLKIGYLLDRKSTCNYLVLSRRFLLIDRKTFWKGKIIHDKQEEYYIEHYPIPFLNYLAARSRYLQKKYRDLCNGIDCIDYYGDPLGERRMFEKGVQKTRVKLVTVNNILIRYLKKTFPSQFKTHLIQTRSHPPFGSISSYLRQVPHDINNICFALHANRSGTKVIYFSSFLLEKNKNCEIQYGKSSSLPDPFYIFINKWGIWLRMVKVLYGLPFDIDEPTTSGPKSVCETYEV